MEWGFALLLAVGILVVLIVRFKNRPQQFHFDPSDESFELDVDYDENGEPISEIGEVRVSSAPEPAQLDMLMGGGDGSASASRDNISTKSTGRAVKDNSGPPQRVLVFHVAKENGEMISGTDIRTAAIAEGLILDLEGFFTRRSQDKKVLYRIANMMKPGYFDSAGFETMQTRGMTMFMGLPGNFDMRAAFDDMLVTATELAKRLDANVFDEQHVRLNEQTARYERDQIIAMMKS